MTSDRTCGEFKNRFMSERNKALLEAFEKGKLLKCASIIPRHLLCFFIFRKKTIKINKKDEKLFSKVIDFPILSTDSNEQKAGKWRKISNNTYEFFLSSSKTISFLIENEKIICKDKDEICKEIQ